MSGDPDHATSWPLWRDAQPLVLASRSATRQAMLTAAGIPVEPVPSGVDERAVEDGARGAGVKPSGIAAALAAAKALDVSARFPGRLVLGADQTLTLGGEALHKPRSRAEASEQLHRMAGRTHVLTSAAALALDGAVLESRESRAELDVRPLSAAAVAAYLDAAGDAVFESVGGYQAEGVGIQLFEAIRGDHFTILGLPLLPLLAALRSLGRVVS